MEPSDALREVVVRVARASTAVNSGDTGEAPNTPGGPLSPTGLSPPQEGGSDAAASEDEDDYRDNLERLIETASSWDSAALVDTDGASRLPSGLAKNATQALLGILEYTQRSDDATAAVLCGHVAYLVRWLLVCVLSGHKTSTPLTMCCMNNSCACCGHQVCSLVGPWTDGLLNASDPLALAFDVAAQHCAPSEDGTVDDASRRPALGLACPGACRVAAAVLPYMAPASAARRVTLATLWLALHAATANVAAASSAGCLPHALTALGHAAQSRDGDASETQALHACVVALASWSCRLSEARTWLAACGRSQAGGPVRAVLLNALAGALSPGSPHGCAPSDVFLLDGETSGLVCPPQAQWPFTDGLSLLTWLRIESVSDSTSASNTAVAAAAAATAAASSRCAPHLTPQAAAATAAAAAGEGESFMPRICSFLSAQGHGVEAYLHGPFVVIEAGPSPGGDAASAASPHHSRSGSHVGSAAHLGRVTFTRPLPQRVWLCVCLECSGGMASLYVDGTLWDSHPLVMPRMQGQPLAFCCIGTNPPAAMVGLQRRRRQCALFCSLGPLYVFDQALGPKTIAALAARGPDHVPVLGYAANPGSSHRCGGYVPTAATCGGDTSSSAAMTTLAHAAALDATLAPSMVCVYHPRMRLHGRTAPDVGPGCAVATGGGIATGHGHVVAGGQQPRGAGGPPSTATATPRGALALTGVATAHRHTLRDALWALSEGGGATLLALVPPCVDPAPDFQPTPGDPRLDSGQPWMAVQAAADAIRSMASSAHGHPGNLVSLAHAGAPAALAHALPTLWAACPSGHGDAEAQQRVCAAHEAVADAVSALSHCAQGHAPLAKALCTCLLLDMQPWRGAARPAVGRVLRALAAMAHAHPAMVRSLGGVRRLLSSVARHVRDMPGAADPRGADDLADDVFLAVELLCGAGGTALDWEQDIGALLECAAQVSSPTRAAMAARALHACVRLLSHPSSGHREAATLGWLAAGGPACVVLLLRHHARAGPRAHAQVLAECIRLVSLHIALAAAGTEQSPGGLSPDAAVSLLRVAVEAAPDVAFTPGPGGPYDALLRCILGGGMATPVLDLPAELAAITSRDASTTPPQVGLLRCLLPALAATSHRQQAPILRDLLLLTCSHPPCRTALAYLPEWPDWMAACIVAAGTDAAAVGDTSREQVTSLASNFLGVSLERALRLPYGWRAAERTIHALRSAALTGDASVTRPGASSHVTSSDSACVASSMAGAHILAALLRFAAGELRAKTEHSGGDGSLGAPLLTATSAGAAAATAFVKSVTDAAGAAAGAASRQVMASNAVALLALTEHFLSVAFGGKAGSGGDPLGWVPPYGPDADAVTACRALRRRLAAEAQADVGRSAKAAGITLAAQPRSPAAVALLTEDAALSAALVTPAAAAAAPRRAAAAPQKALVDDLLDTMFMFGPAALATTGPAVPEAALPAPSPAKPRASATSPALLTMAVSVEREPFAVGVQTSAAAKAAWTDTLFAAAELVEHVLGNLAHLSGSPAQPVATMLVQQPQQHLQLLRLTLAALRADAQQQQAQEAQNGSPAGSSPGSGGVVRSHRLEAVLQRLLAPLLMVRTDSGSGPAVETVVAVAATLYDSLAAQATALGVPVGMDPPTALVFSAWRAGQTQVPGALATFADMVGGQRLQQPALLAANGAATAPPSAAVTALVSALLAPFAGVLRHWRTVLAPALSDPLGRSPLKGGALSAADDDGMFSDTAHGLGDATLRGAARVAPNDGLAVFAGTTWVVALTLSAAPEAPSVVALVRRANASLAARDARLRAWRGLAATLVTPDSSASSATTSTVQRVTALLLAERCDSGGEEGRAESSVLTTRSATWRRLMRRLAEANALFGGQDAATSLFEGRSAAGMSTTGCMWVLDPTEDGLRARRRLRRCWGPTMSSFVAPRMSSDAAVAQQHSPLAAARRALMSAGLDGGDNGEGLVAAAARAAASGAARMFTDVTWVTILGAAPGSLALTRNTLTFIPGAATDTAEAQAGAVPRAWSVHSVVQLHARRYCLRRTALELFLLSRTVLLFDFSSSAQRTAFAEALLAVKPEHLVSVQGDPPEAPSDAPGDGSVTSMPTLQARLLRPPQQLLRRELTRRWQRHELSNLGYLVELNTLAGRSFNDLAQWPVLPWCLSGVALSSPRLDLSDASHFRDLRKPMGVLDPVRAARFAERYQSLAADPSPQPQLGPASPATPGRRSSTGWGAGSSEILPAGGAQAPFHYGSHYSSAAGVLHSLVRLPPFTLAALDLHGGRLDVPDRLFSSVAATWASASGGPSLADVAELTPEWYTCPSIFVNAQDLPLGSRQDGSPVHDVALPSWAANAHDFVASHADALEAEAVSQALPAWIDLVFGTNQRGPGAVSCQNVFHPVTYEGAVDTEALKKSDPPQWRAVLAQIAHFGQTPSQLLTTPHPPRWASSLVRPPVTTSPRTASCFIMPVPPSHRAAAMCMTALPGGQLMLVTHQLQVVSHTLQSATQGNASIAGQPPVAFTLASLPASSTGGAGLVTAIGDAGRFTATAAAPSAGGTLTALLNGAASLLVGAPVAEEPVPVGQSRSSITSSSPGLKGKPPRPGAGANSGLDLRLPGLPSASLLMAEPPGPSKAAVSSDGRILILAGALDCSIRAYDTSDAAHLRCVQAVTVHRAPVCAVATSRDGRLLAAASKDGSITTWLLTGPTSAPLSASSAAPAPTAPGLRPAEMTAGEISVAATPAAALAAAADAIALDNAQGGSAAPSGQEWDGSAAPGGGVVAAAVDEAPHASLNVAYPPLTGPLHFLRGCAEPPACVAVSAECDTVAAVCPSAGLVCWSLIRGEVLCVQPRCPGTRLALTPSGYAVVYDPTARTLSCAACSTGEVVATVSMPVDEGHITAMVPSADGRGLVTGTTPGAGGTGAGRVWFRSVPMLREEYRFALPDGQGVTSMSLLEGDTLLAVGTTAGGLLVICDPMTLPPRPVLERLRDAGAKAMQYD